jgi:hypothetical protein
LEVRTKSELAKRREVVSKAGNRFVAINLGHGGRTQRPPECRLLPDRARVAVTHAGMRGTNAQQASTEYRHARCRPAIASRRAPLAE